MLRQITLFFALCLVAFGCTKKNSEETARFHSDGRSKPVVSLVRVFDRCDSNIAWSLSDEFTDQLVHRFSKDKNICLIPQDEVLAATEFLTEKNNPFAEDFSWIPDAFNSSEFVVFTELVEHDIRSKKAKNNFIDKLTPSCELFMTMRIRIFDLRGETPTIVLQELIHQNHLIPKPSDLSQESPERWKKVSFHISPLGLAHSQFAKEVANRVEDYILLAKSR